MKRRHVPMRTCIGCRESLPKRDLARVVRTPAGELEYDPTGKRSGRGAYICPRRACLDLAVRRGALESALEVPVPAELVARIRELIEPDDGEE